MKISSVLNYSLHNQYHSNREKTAPQFQYSYNLPCDTVSFGRLKTMAKDDFGLDERDVISDSLVKHIQNDSIEQAFNQIKRLDDTKWNPNYCVIDYENGNKSLLGLVIDKFAEDSENGQDWDYLMSLSEKIISHPDFKIVNEESKEDLLLSSIGAYCAEVATQLVECDDFMMNFDKFNLDIYEKTAKKVGLIGIFDEISSVKKVYPIEGEHSTPVATDVAGIKKALSIYEVPQNANDPKSLDEVGGMFQVKKDINEFILKPWNKNFRDKIIENRLNRPSGFLLSGPPGCGKTYIMKAIAAETGYNLYEINLANIGDSEAYKTQNELKKVFDNLENLYKKTGEPSILVLDELDSMAMSRKNCHTDWKKDDINTLLMVMNNSAQRGIIIVGATNNPEDLDEAVKRSGRLDKHIKIGLPELEERKDIVEKILHNRPIGAELLENKDEIAEKLKGLSPADISSILHNACLNAIYEYKDSADMDDFNKMFDALKRDTNDKGRIVIKGYTP